MRNKWVRWASRVLMLATMVVIFLLSGQSTAASYRTSDKFSRIIEAEQFGDVIVMQNSSNDSGNDVAEENAQEAVIINYRVFGFLDTRKLGHIILYFSLGVFSYWSFGWKWRGVIAVSLGYLYACSDEIHQHFVGRTGCFTDTLIDSVGIVLAVVVCECVYRIVRRKAVKPKQNNVAVHE